MSPGTPIVIVFTVLVLVMLIRAFAPPDWVEYLFRDRDVRPSGPDGHFRRVDFLRRAGLGVGIGFLLLAGSFIVGGVSERWPNSSMANQVGMVYTFALVLLGGVALLSAVLDLWRAARYRVPPNTRMNGTSATDG